MLRKIQFTQYCPCPMSFYIYSSVKPDLNGLDGGTDSFIHIHILIYIYTHTPYTVYLGTRYDVSRSTRLLACYIPRGNTLRRQNEGIHKVEERYPGTTILCISIYILYTYVHTYLCIYIYLHLLGRKARDHFSPTRRYIFDDINFCNIVLKSKLVCHEFQIDRVFLLTSFSISF